MIIKFESLEDAVSKINNFFSNIPENIKTPSKKRNDTVRKNIANHKKQKKLDQFFTINEDKNKIKNNNNIIVDEENNNELVCLNDSLHSTPNRHSLNTKLAVAPSNVASTPSSFGLNHSSPSFDQVINDSNHNSSFTFTNEGSNPSNGIFLFFVFFYFLFISIFSIFFIFYKKKKKKSFLSLDLPILLVVSDATT